MINVLDTASVGRPITREGVALFPVYINQPVHDGLLIGFSSEVVEVTEVDGGVVPVLRVINHGPHTVLLPEGETVCGGRQNRVLNVSVLVPGNSTVDVPVSCVEQGRWNQGHSFERTDWKAPRSVRTSMVTGLQANLRSGRKVADQAMVWSAVDGELVRFAVTSDTESLLDLRRSTVDDRSGRAAGELIAMGPLPKQCGVVVARGGRTIGAEVFGTPELLADNWAGIVHSAMLEADGTDRRPSATKALRFLHRFATGSARVEPGVGIGEEVHVRTKSLVGQALLLDGCVVHASAFTLAA